MKRFMLMMMALCFAIVTFAKGDIKTVVFTPTPQMHCQNCENKIKNNIRFEKGVKTIKTDLKNQTVTITYDSEKTNVEKLKAGFEKIGFKVVVKENKGLKG
ncbi:MAG: heavy-metal-associated domain-containing protein [Bacteroidaceae bacterium]|nr:cation transporter [Candidatus Minthousia equi]MCQ2246203.1 heavy-metal-associated domain-containing protein [Bacteroidaceae bacterium]MDO4957426.1 heavy-metal-associated domain-containing protein [Bacteroidales bacterium]